MSYESPGIPGQTPAGRWSGWMHILCEKDSGGGGVGRENDTFLHERAKWYAPSFVLYFACCNREKKPSRPNPPKEKSLLRYTGWVGSKRRGRWWALMHIRPIPCLARVRRRADKSPYNDGPPASPMAAAPCPLLPIFSGVKMGGCPKGKGCVTHVPYAPGPKRWRDQKCFFLYA